MILKVLLVICFIIVKGDANGCIRRDFGEDSFVCVCNATYCDETPDLEPLVPEKGAYYWYVSTKDGLRLNVTKGYFGPRRGYSATLTLDSNRTYQSIHGFGGAFTDSAGLNIKKLSTAAQDQLLRAYYGTKGGSRYNLGRVPIGGCDFSTRPYTYDDYSNDNLLSRFSLTMEDYHYKIPFIKKALELNPDTKIFGAAWTAPPWMKTNNDYTGFGFLRKEHYQTFVNYLLKFLNEYKKYGIDFWAISTGNEPMNAFAPFFKINNMGWTPKTVAEWIANNLGPSLAESPHNNTLILAIDDQRFTLPWYPDGILANAEAEKHIAGIALHWYWDHLISPRRLTQTHDRHPDKFLLMSEACTGSAVWEFPKVALGSWVRGEQYVLSIIESLNHWMTGWVDWNLALDETGGPNWVDNYVDAPIIVNPETDEFYKQPMYYALKHFSRFVKRGSVRIAITDTRDVKTTAFATPSNEIVVVLYNRKAIPRNVAIVDVERGTIQLKLLPYSINTVIYRQK